MPKEIVIEGLSAKEILALSEEELGALVFCDEPVVFRMGSALVLGEFRLGDGALILELASIDGGGEGVLMSLSTLARRFARSRGLAQIEWIVHAIHCADPNLKLQRVLDRRGFVKEEVGGALAYHKIEMI